MHHAVWRMGGVSGKKKAALCQSQEAESQTSRVTVRGEGTGCELLCHVGLFIRQAYLLGHVSRKNLEQPTENWAIGLVTSQ